MTSSPAVPLSPHALHDELRRLRRLCQGLTATMTLALLAVVAVAAMGQTKPTVVEAQRFVVKDARGTPRVILGTFGEVSALNLYDKEGRARAALQAGADGTAWLTFLDREGRSRARIYVDHNGGANVGFFGSDLKTRAEVVVSADGNASAGLFDRDGNPVWPGNLFMQ